MSESKYILVLADGFGAPAYTPRLRYLCEQLLQDGYNIDVVVEHIDDLPFHHTYSIDEVYLYNGGKTDWALKNFWSLLTDWKNRAFSRYVETHYGNRHYDAVFCTTFHTFPLRAAIEFSQRHHIPVTLDLRDIVEQAPHNPHNYLRHSGGILNCFVGIYNRINIGRRNHWLKLATHITTVSPWHASILDRGSTVGRPWVVYNGYDALSHRWKEVKTDRFILSYTGKFFGMPLQDATLLFEALQALQDEIPYTVEVHTNPNGKDLLKQMAEQYGIANRFEIGDYIPHNEAIELYHRSSILLIFSNRASDETGHGMMTTKFFEALGVEKPALCVRSDEEVLAATMAQTNAGLAATNREETMAFIREKYKEWRTNGYTRQAVNNKEQFSRQAEGKQIEKILF